ncbi:unnamed protein product [Echinostoma caproni]|uniref:Uncharacterized protein n=1 Tax=Echinostoma caproni TaxID=27848 RepID=A0A3P8HPZ2_9TREM|nr:unnamed protein product [Echinostoma caproni]
MERLFGDEARAVNDPFVRRGILQSIGFKEFADYLALPAASERASPVGQQLLSSAIDRVKIATRQYARRQVRVHCPPFFQAISQTLGYCNFDDYIGAR